MLVQFKRDTVLYPLETAHFNSFTANGKHLLMEDQELYKKNTFGMKQVEDNIEWTEINGDHLEFTEEHVIKEFAPFLRR